MRLGSSQNWRWEKKPKISLENRSKEKQIEKAIVSERGDEWVNQVPTASGLMTSTNEQHCNVDLAHRISNGVFELIELKYGSNTPVFAAFEILKYGLLYVFSRTHADELGYGADREMLHANQIALCVLAPYSYYSDYRVDWLEKDLASALGTCVDIPGLRMTFRFDQFSPQAADVNGVLGTRHRLHGGA